MADNVPGPEGAPPSPSPLASGSVPEGQAPVPSSHEDKASPPTKTVVLSSLAKPPPLPQPTSKDLKQPSPSATQPLHPPIGARPRMVGVPEVKLPPKTAELPRLSATGKLPRLILPSGTPITMPPVAKGNAPSSEISGDKKGAVPAAQAAPPPLPVKRPEEAKKQPKPAEPKPPSQIKLNPPSPKPGAFDESIFPPEEKPEPEHPPEGWKHLEAGELHPLKDDLQSLEVFTRSQRTPESGAPKPLTTLPPVTPTVAPPALRPPVVLSSPAPVITAKAAIRPPPLPPPKPAEKATAPAPNTAPPLLGKTPALPGEKLRAPNLPGDSRKAETPLIVVGKSPTSPKLSNALQVTSPLKPATTPVGKAPPSIPTKPAPSSPPPVAKREKSIPLFLFPPAKPKPKPTGQAASGATGKAASPGAASPTIKVEEAKPALKAAVLSSRTLASQKAAPPSSSAATSVKPAATPSPAQPPPTAARITPPATSAAAAKPVEAIKLPTLPVKTVIKPPASPAPLPLTIVTSKSPATKAPDVAAPTLPAKAADKSLITVGAAKPQEAAKLASPATSPGVVPPDKTGSPAVLPPPTTSSTPATVPTTRAIRMRKKRLVEVIVFYSVLVIIIVPLLYLGALHFSSDTGVSGEIIPPQGMLLGNEVWIVGDFRELAGGVTQDLTQDRAPKLQEIQEHQEHVQRAQADVAAREERIRLLREQIQAAKDDIASVVKKAHDASQQVWDGPGAQLEDEYNARLEQLQKTIVDRAKALNLKYQPDDSYRSPEVWANAYRLALYDVPTGVDSAKEHQWIEDQIKQWRDFTKSLDTRQKQLREQAAQIQLSPTQKVTELNTKIEELQQRIEGTLAEEEPIKTELQQAQTDLTQVQAVENSLDDKYYKQLYALPEGSITDRIPLAPNGRFRWSHIEKNKPFADGENFHHYYLFARALRPDGRQYWALLHLSVAKNNVLPVTIEPSDFISTKAVLRPDLSPDEQEK